MVACFLAATGARDQLLVAALRERLGPSGALLVVSLVSSVATAALAGWFGGRLAAKLSADAATMLVAIALLLASFECAWPHRFRKPEEPTRSFGAIGIVLFARQLTDASRFLVVAFAAALASPALAGLGGALGGGAAVALGWMMGEELERQLPLRRLRVLLSAALFAIAIVIGLSARGLV